MLSRVLLALGLALSLTSCGGEDAEEVESLLAPQVSPGATPTPTETLPEPPVDTLDPDLTSPEGVARAYMAYRHLGEGEEACSLLAPNMRAQFGGEATCIQRVEEYAADLIYTYEDSLDVAEEITVRVSKRGGGEVEVGALLTPAGNEDDFVVEGMTLKPQGEEWRIVGLATVDSQQEGDPGS